MKSLDILCSHFPLCSGCALNTDVASLDLFKEAQEFFATRGIADLQLHVGAPCGWRCRAKLAVRGTQGEPLIGLFQEGSHQVINIPQCKVYHPLINQAVHVLKKWISTHEITPYEEKTRKGVLRYAQFAVDRENKRVQLVLILNQKQQDPLLCKALDQLWEEHKELWHSLWLNFNTRKDNVITGKDWLLLHGEKWLWELFCGRKICFHPAAFAQANPEMFEKLLLALKEFVPRGTHVSEFYAGGGVIGLTVAEKAKSILFNEIVPLAEQSFQESCKDLPMELKEKLRFVCGSAETQTHLLTSETDLVIVDPPRKGLDPSLLKKLCLHSSLKRLIYVSCGWESFKRDCDHLLEKGWFLTSAQSFLFFPGSRHLEVLAIFDKKVLT